MTTIEIEAAIEREPNTTTLPPTDSPSSSTTQATHTNASLLARLSTHFLLPIRTETAYIPLLISSLVAGLMDGSSFAAWGVFTGMQTGNTIFIALGASQQPVGAHFIWLKALIAVVAFLASCYAIPRAMRLWGHAGLTRAGLTFSFGAQSACLAVAAILVSVGVVPQSHGLVTPAVKSPDDPFLVELAPIAFMAFQAGGQITASRLLGYNEIPTIVLTSAYCDLASDGKVWKLLNPKRDRRVLSAALLLVGAIGGGWITRSAGMLETVIWLGAFLKAVCALGFAFWTGREERIVDGEK